MSLFPSEHFSISLTSAAIGVAVHRGRWHPKKAELFEVPVEGEGLGAVLATLSSILENRAKAGATVRFTVSNRFCRVALLPWAGSSLTAKERTLLAQRQFADLYGDMSAWEIRGDTHSGYEQSCMAFAMPTELLLGLKEVTKSLSLSCRAISPHALSSWNRHGEQMNRAGLFAVVEAESAFVMSIRGPGKDVAPSSARMLPLGGGQASQSLEMLIERELLLSEQMDEPMVLCDGLGASLFGLNHRFCTVPYPADMLGQASAMAVNGAST